MASIVKANANLATGGMAVLKRAFQTEREGKLTYSAEYVCLAQFATRHVGKFKTGAQPPTPIPQTINSLAVKEVPKLYDLQTETVNGLTYFRATYVAAGDSEASFSVTESSEQRSFQGSANKIIKSGPPEFQFDNPVTDFLSFDYISITRTSSSSNRDAPSVAGGVGARFNIRATRTFSIGGTVPGNEINVPNTATTIDTQSSTRNSDGTFSFSLSSTGIYTQDEDLRSR